MSSSQNHRFEFGEFFLDAAEKQLLRNGTSVPLPPKVFDTLVVLVRNSGHLVEKEFLMHEVWPDTFVEDVNLSVNISAIRKVLGETSDGGPYIETVPKRGYRFVGVVTNIEDGESELIVGSLKTGNIGSDERTNGIAEVAPSTVSLSNPGPDDFERQRSRFASRGGFLVTFGLTIALTMIGALVWHGRKPAVSAASAPIRSIAVLPFKPLSRESREEYFETGIADALISRLSELKQLTVRPTSSVRRFAGVDQDPIAAGKELKVDAVVDGSVQLVGDRIRVNVQLVSVRDGAVLWTYRCEDLCSDIFTIQDSVSENIANALALRLSTVERELLAKRYTNNPDALRAFLKGRYYYGKRTRDAAQQAIDSFQLAIQLDPNYALAYSALAYAYASASFLNASAPQEGMPKARAAAERALELDNSLGEAHGALAVTKLTYDRDWSGAETELRRALELNPNDVDAHQFMGDYLLAMGRLDEAIDEMNKSQDLDPLSLFVKRDLGRAYYYARQYDRAIQIWQEISQQDPRFPVIYNWLRWGYQKKGMYKEAIDSDLHMKALGGWDKESIEEMRAIFDKSGWSGYMSRLLANRLEHQSSGSAYSIAELDAELGKKDEAFQWLTRAEKERSIWVIWLKVDPMFDSLHDDPRWSVLMQSLRFEKASAFTLQGDTRDTTGFMPVADQLLPHPRSQTLRRGYAALDQAFEI